MIKIENVVLPSAEQWEAVIRGMRNPMNSWDLSDSEVTFNDNPTTLEDAYPQFFMGDADNKLAKNLADGGSVHAKYRRMIPVYLDITAPLYFWKELDTYKVGTVANSCSTMHKIAEKAFVLSDFSFEHLLTRNITDHIVPELDEDHNLALRGAMPIDALVFTINMLNSFREDYLAALKAEDENDTITEKDLWWQLIQLLPSSYNQRRTVMLNYEVLCHMYSDRKDHKLDEWRDFCEWIKTLPYSELIIPKQKRKENKKK